MSSLADRTIAALHDSHDAVSAVIDGLSDSELAQGSGSSEWDVAQVLSHLGSGAEIVLANLQASLAGRPAPESSFNQQVWDRWDAMGRREKAAGFLEHDTRLLDAYDALDAHTRDTLQVDMGFLPAPLPLSSVLGMRLNEAAAHCWDVQVAFEPAAGLPAATAELLAEHLSGGIGFLLGFIGKPDAVDGRAAVAFGDSGYGLLVDDGVSLTTTLVDPTGVLHGPLEAGIRLLTGRLREPYTPPGVQVSGEPSLPRLRSLFPGF